MVSFRYPRDNLINVCFVVQCEGCGDLIKRAINREPSAGDCMERFRENGSCGNTSCHWHK